MNKLSKEKRSQLILVAILTAGAIGGLWYFLISYQLNRLKQAGAAIAETQKKNDKARGVVAESARIEADMKAATQKLAALEMDMPAGDLYSWFISRIKQFNVPSYHVEIPQLGQPGVGEVPLFANFPYNQATVSVGGTACYWDLGKFIADFENRFPYARVQNLSLEPSNGGATPEERERLAFHMEIVILLKPNNS